MESASTWTCSNEPEKRATASKNNELLSVWLLCRWLGNVPAVSCSEVGSELAVWSVCCIQPRTKKRSGVEICMPSSEMCSSRGRRPLVWLPGSRCPTRPGSRERNEGKSCWQLTECTRESQKSWRTDGGRIGDLALFPSTGNPGGFVGSCVRDKLEHGGFVPREVAELGRRR